MGYTHESDVSEVKPEMPQWLVFTFKIKHDKKSEYLQKKLSCKYNYETRLASGNAIQNLEKIESDKCLLFLAQLGNGMLCL